ncbi:MAG TPA: histidine decarboxylase [Pilimelia sp.]|nr:histidine decarboxylase [Pilimelia sp.]
MITVPTAPPPARTPTTADRPPVRARPKPGGTGSQKDKVDTDTEDGTSDHLAALMRSLKEDRATNIGFPGAVDFDYTALFPFFNQLINNVGDPFVDGVGGAHTKAMEREVIAFFADLFRAPTDDRWGYVTTGGTEGNLYGLHLARAMHTGGLVYCSEATHYSVAKSLEVLRMPAVIVRARETGEIDYEDLRWLLSHHHRDRPAIIHANVGTTMTEASDDVAAIKRMLRNLAVPHYIHVDAALAGIPLALAEPRPAFDLRDGADSICISGHKFIGVPFPCGVVITRQSLTIETARPAEYTGSPDTTLGGSRSGHAALILWYALRKYGMEGLRKRAAHSRELAEYTVRRLNDIGWDAWRNPLAFTVVLRTPPPEVNARWTLARGSDGWSHIVCMPGVTRATIDAFLDDLRAAYRPPARRPNGRHHVTRPLRTTASAGAAH